MLVRERLDASFLEQVFRRLRHVGALSRHVFVYVLDGSHGGSACDFTVPQHALIGLGHVFFRQIGMSWQVHGNVGQRRRQAVGCLQVAFACGVHR